MLISNNLINSNFSTRNETYISNQGSIMTAEYEIIISIGNAKCQSASSQINNVIWRAVIRAAQVKLECTKQI